jgi:hypothetical protein
MDNYLANGCGVEGVCWTVDYDQFMDENGFPEMCSDDCIYGCRNSDPCSIDCVNDFDPCWNCYDSECS